MTRIPKKLREELSVDPEYRTCARAGLHGHTCAGRVTFDHALIFGGRQVQKRFAIVPLCAKAHSVDEWQDRGDLDKEVNQWIALNRATEEELRGISKAIDYVARLAYLNKKYGAYTPRVAYPVNSLGINYGFPVENREEVGLRA